MAQFLESYPRGGSTAFDKDLEIKTQWVKERLSKNTCPIQGGMLYFHQYDYDRTPVLSAAFLENYAPFQIMGMALSASDYPVDNTHAKPFVYSINSYKSTARNSAGNTWPLEQARDMNIDIPYNWDRNVFVSRGVSILHTTDTAEQTYADGWLLAHGALQDNLLSAMLMPSPSHTVRFYRDAERPDRVFITVNKISVMLMHKIVAMLPIMFSIRLAELPIPPLPDLFNTFTALDADAFITHANTWLDNIGTRIEELMPLMMRATLTRNLTAFGERVSRYLTSSKQAVISQYSESILQKENEIREYYAKLQEAMLAMQTGQETEIQALIDYLPRIQDLRGFAAINDTQCGFHFSTTIQHYSLEEAERIMEAKRTRGSDKLARVLEYIFFKEEYSIVINQGFYLNFKQNPQAGVERRYGKWDPPSGSMERDTARNPHITYFGNGCWGDNARYIDKAMIAGSYLTAFNIALSAIRTVNLADGTAMNHLYERLLINSYGKCIRRNSDGERFDIEGFLQATDPTLVTTPVPEVDLVNEALDAVEPIDPNMDEEDTDNEAH